ncbi:MAG TPA: ribonuclease HI [Trichormus sp.]
MKAASSSSILIFTDGACSGNPGPGGWGCIVALPDGTVREMGGHVPQTTNNRMEMAAALRALISLDDSVASGITLYTDSTYLIKGIKEWVYGWMRRGWKTAEGKDVANQDLWRELMREVGRLKHVSLDWKYVRGHDGNPGNERCDQIAVAYRDKKNEPLYAGDRAGYFVDLNQLPGEAQLPEMKKQAGGGKPQGAAASNGRTTYLSYLGGIVTRHTTWTDCEKHVKGRPAKFKKAKSAQEEKEILVGWGLDPGTAIE